MTSKIESAEVIGDEGVEQFVELARSANVFFEFVAGKLVVRAVNPNWLMWRPIAHFLDEIGRARIEAYFKGKSI